jgi:RNA polymerase primary sigma factor
VEAPRRERTAEVLDAGTERALALRAHSSVEARDRLILANLPLVAHVARDYRGARLPFEDLVHEGIVGLLEAVRRFDPERGTRFSTYAAWWIRKHILEALHAVEAPLRLPDHRRREVGRIARAASDLGALLHRAPLREEISARMATTVERVDRLLAGRATAVSLDEGRAEDDPSPLSERLADPRARLQERGMIAAESRRALLEAFSGLPPRQKYVLGRRLGIDGGPELSLREIGVELNLSRERVRQVETAALRVLRRRVVRVVGSSPAI